MRDREADVKAVTVVLSKHKDGWEWRALTRKGEQVAASKTRFVSYTHARAEAIEKFPHARVTFDKDAL